MSESRTMHHTNGLPPAQGLYNPANEHDACGIGFVVNITGQKSHDIVAKGIQVLINLTHRGACGCDPETGDGAGVTIQIPHKFFARECSRLGFTLPPAGVYGIAMTFLPVEKRQRLLCEGILERISREEGLSVLGWRDTPIDGSAIGRVARGSQPYIEQLFVRGASGLSEDALERKLYVVRKRAETEVAASDMDDKGDFYIPSFSARTIVYKGLLLAPQIAHFYHELADPDVMSALCLVHQRFSTNTFPTWQLAHPFRYIAHNGEINTLKGNVNWMYARQSILASPLSVPGRPAHGACHGHADSRSLVIERAHASRQEGVLRISRFFDGTLGRPRRDRLHRRPRDRRYARPQRSAAGALPGNA